MGDLSGLNRGVVLASPLQLAFIADAIGPDDWRRRDPTLRHILASLEANDADGAPVTERLWHDHGHAIVRQFQRTRPGERPACWWRWSAPKDRRPGETDLAFLDRHQLLTLGERKRLSGVNPPSYGANVRIKAR